ncbi:hypothetical protein GCM10027597_42040 [Saccharopolyspora tripterygii]
MRISTPWRWVVETGRTDPIHMVGNLGDANVPRAAGADEFRCLEPLLPRIVDAVPAAGTAPHADRGHA